MRPRDIQGCRLWRYAIAARLFRLRSTRKATSWPLRDWPCSERPSRDASRICKGEVARSSSCCPDGDHEKEHNATLPTPAPEGVFRACAGTAQTDSDAGTHKAHSNWYLALTRINIVWGGRWDLNPRHSEPQSEASGGSPNDFRGFSTQKGRKREQKRRVFNPSFSQVSGPVKKTTKKRESPATPLR
jgi:hypothetical protein